MVADEIRSSTAENEPKIKSPLDILQNKGNIQLPDVNITPQVKTCFYCMIVIFYSFV